MSILKKDKLSKNILASLITIIFSVITIIIGVSVVKAITISSGPTAQNIGAVSADIVWQTNENGDSQVYYTANAPGWNRQNYGTSRLFNIDMLNRGGWIVGEFGLILHSSFGNNWAPQASGVGVNLLGVDAVNADTAWAVGLVRTIVKTTNGGLTWVKQSGGSGSHLYGISALDSDNAWTVGTNGAIYKTTNGGTTWDTLDSGTAQLLIDVEALNTKVVWAVGTNGTILKTLDGGNTWQPQVSGTTYSINKVVVLDSMNVWAAGSYGLILRTSDGGATWVKQSSGTGNSFNGIHAYTTSSACVVGGNGTFLCTTNGGTSWINYTADTGNFETLHAVYMKNDTNIWAVGEGGAIVYYGINYDSFKYNATQLTNHNMTLTGLSPLTTYNYYVCSKTAAGAEVCSNNYSFTTRAACPDGTPDGQCNPVTHQYCNGTTLVPAVGPNCVRWCGIPCDYDPDLPYCDPVTETCIAACSDGTLAGACSSNRYCDPATLQFSNSCVVNKANCPGFSCPAASPYCNPANGLCEAKCSDGTAFGSCNASLQYCDSGTLRPASGSNCVHCGFNCATTPLTPYCDPTTQTCVDRCSDGTAKGSCNASGQYCDPVTVQLSNNCSVNDTNCPAFSCPAATPYCNPANGLCEAKCSDGTAADSCNASLNYCDPSFVLHTDCQTNIAECGFSCPASAPFCDGTNCLARCADGTEAGFCAGNMYCDPVTLTLVADCSRCGYTCPGDTPYCNPTTHLCQGDRCADGTPLDTCRADQQYCDPVTKTISYNCTKCGYTCVAPAAYCNPTNGQCEAKCPPSGTDPNACDGTRWCNPATYALEENCNHCGFTCPASAPFCNTGTGACENRCADGTASGSCSGTRYCDPASLTLVSDCRECGYTCVAPTPQCNLLTGVCEVDDTPPEIFNINASPDVYSATITFETSESAWAIVTLDTSPICDGLVDIKGQGFNLSHSFLFGFPSVALTPSTQYYFCITAIDVAGNVATKVEPKDELTFTTLEEPDLTPPTVTIISPTEGETISRTYTIEVAASDLESGLDRVEIYLDGLVDYLVAWNDEPFTYSFDTTLQENGDHFLQAFAYDNSGNSAQSEVRNFTINNDSSPPVISDVNAEVDVSPDGHYAVITWKTDEPATSRVDYTLEGTGGSEDYDHTYGGDVSCTRVTPKSCKKDDTLVLDHQITLTNLEANRRYHYRLTSCDAEGNCAH